MSGSKQDRFTCEGKSIFMRTLARAQEQIPRVGGKVSQSTNRADAEDER